MCPRLSANYVSCCPPNMAQVSVWAGNLHYCYCHIQGMEKQQKEIVIGGYYGMGHL